VIIFQNFYALLLCGMPVIERSRNHQSKHFLTISHYFIIFTRLCESKRSLE